MRSAKRIGNLMYLAFRKELTASQEKELNDWRELSPKNEELFQRETDPEHLRRSLARMNESSERSFQKVLDQLAAENKEQPPPPIRYRFARIAATLILFIGGGIYSILMTPEYGQPGSYRADINSYNNRSHILEDIKRGFSDGRAGVKIRDVQGERVYAVPDMPSAGKDEVNTITTPRGGTFAVQFPDGTFIWLNAESTIEYPSNFSQDTIRVKVTGETYFEIPNNARIPLRIQAGALRSVAPGARLRIKAYSDEPMSVTVIGGNAAVRSNFQPVGEPAIIPIRESEQVVLINQHPGILHVNDVDNLIAWTNGRTVFRNAGLGTIMKDISRWYDVDLQYMGGMPERLFNMDLPRNAELKEVFKALEKQGIHAFLFGHTVTVSTRISMERTRLNNNSSLKIPNMKSSKSRKLIFDLIPVKITMLMIAYTYGLLTNSQIKQLALWWKMTPEEFKAVFESVVTPGDLCKGLRSETGEVKLSGLFDPEGNQINQN